MNRRTTLVALLVLVAVPILATRRAPVEAQRDQPQRETPPPTLRVHEWGVWIVEEGRVTLDALAAESPPFVLRARPNVTPPEGVRPTPHTGPTRPPVVRPHPVTVRKPVVFFHASEPTEVAIDVRFRQGTPWLLYPAASEAQGNRLMWRGTVGVPGTPPPVDAQHWWQDLRDVGADGFATDRGGYERFLFYDGEVRFEPLFRFTRVQGSAEPRIAPTRDAEGPLFVVTGAAYVEHAKTGRRWGESARGTTSALRARMREALLARGLGAPESDALLDVWSDELFGAGAARAIYFVPRAVYDRMLPMRIAPTPTELVRVGVVIERL